MGKTQLSFCVVSWVDDDIDAMAYPSLRTPVSKVQKGRGKGWSSSLPLGEGDGGQGWFLTYTVGKGSGQHSAWEPRQGPLVAEPSDSSIATSSHVSCKALTTLPSLSGLKLSLWGALLNDDVGELEFLVRFSLSSSCQSSKWLCGAAHSYSLRLWPPEPRQVLLAALAAVTSPKGGQAPGADTHVRSF